MRYKGSRPGRVFILTPTYRRGMYWADQYDLIPDSPRGFIRLVCGPTWEQGLVGYRPTYGDRVIADPSDPDLHMKLYRLHVQGLGVELPIEYVR